MDAAALFHELTAAVREEPGVTVPDEAGRSGFGSTALKVDGRIFAMLVGGELVLKLPRDRVAALVDGGAGRPFANGKGQPMREWAVLTSTQPDAAVALGREALAFVGADGLRPGTPRRAAGRPRR